MKRRGKDCAYLRMRTESMKQRRRGGGKKKPQKVFFLISKNLTGGWSNELSRSSSWMERQRSLYQPIKKGNGKTLASKCSMEQRGGSNGAEIWSKKRTLLNTEEKGFKASSLGPILGLKTWGQERKRETCARSDRKLLCNGRRKLGSWEKKLVCPVKKKKIDNGRGAATKKQKPHSHCEGEILKHQPPQTKV